MTLFPVKNTWSTGDSFAAADQNGHANATNMLYLQPTSVKTGAYTAAPQDLVPCNATSGAFAVTLPNAPADFSRVQVVKGDSSANTVTVAAAGSDVFNAAGGPTTLTLNLQHQSLLLQYSASPKIWYTVSDAVADSTKVALSTVTAKGDLIAGTGSSAVTKLSVGPNQQVLVSDSSQATGLRWADNTKLELFHDFSTDPNGAPVTANSGQTWTLTYGPTSAAAPVVAGGHYIENDTSASTSASYVSAQLSGSAVYLEADFAFGSTGSTDTQAATVVAWATALPSGAIGAIPDSPAHVSFTDTFYQYGVWSGGTFTVVGTVTYGTAMGTTAQHIEISIDAANSTAYVRGPDGSVNKFTNGLIGVAADYVTAEIFYNAANTDKRVSYNRFAASPTPINQQSTAPNRAMALKEESAALAATLAASPTIHAPKIDYIADPSGNNILNTVAAGSAANYLQISNGATASAPIISTNGTDTNIDLDVIPKGTGAVNIYAGTGVTPTLKAIGADANIDLNLVPKGTGQVKVNGVPFKPPGWAPSDYGFIDWAFDPTAIYSGFAITATAGIMFLVGIPIRAATTITNVCLLFTAAGSGLTSGQNFAALYQGGNLLAATADQHTAWQSSGLQTMALTSPQAVTAGLVYVGFYFNGTTAPSIAYAISGLSAGDVVNINGVHRTGYDATNTGQTTTPHSTLGTITNYVNPFWAAVS